MTFPCLTSLFHQHELFHVHKIPRLESVEIDATGQVAGIKRHRVKPRLHLTIDQRGYLLPKRVEHDERDMR